MFSIRTQDGVLFDVDDEVTMKMETLKLYFEDENCSNEPCTIPLPNVNSDLFAMIIDYIKTHLDFKEKAKKNENRVSGLGKYGAFTEDVRIYDKQFLEKLDNDALKELLLAANYLNVNELEDFLKQAIADKIENKSVEYVRNFFGIQNDYNPKEEAKMFAEHPWAFEGVDED